jgi:hypothetical protein
MSSPTPAFLLFDEARHDGAHEPADAAALLVRVAWLRFSAPWRAQDERNRHLVAALTQHSKSRFTQNVFLGAQMQELTALQGAFAAQQPALVAAVEVEVQHRGQRLSFQHRLGLQGLLPC